MAENSVMKELNVFGPNYCLYLSRIIVTEDLEKPPHVSKHYFDKYSWFKFFEKTFYSQPLQLVRIMK